MAQTYLLFDLGSDEEKVQQARHKLESWKQAFRLDKKLQYKLEREQFPEPGSTGEKSKAKEEPAKPEKSSSAKGKTKSKSKPKSGAAESEDNGPVKLFVRLYFSGHEKLSEQRWIDRIPTEEPFKDSAPKIVREGEPSFDEILKQFDTLE